MTTTHKAAHSEAGTVAGSTGARLAQGTQELDVWAETPVMAHTHPWLETVPVTDELVELASPIESGGLSLIAELEA